MSKADEGLLRARKLRSANEERQKKCRPEAEFQATIRIERALDRAALDAVRLVRGAIHRGGGGSATMSPGSFCVLPSRITWPRHMRDEREAKKIQRLVQKAIMQQTQAEARAIQASHASINLAERRARSIMERESTGRLSDEGFATLLARPGVRLIRPVSAKSSGNASTRPVSKAGRVSFHFEMRDITTSGVLAELMNGSVRIAQKRGKALKNVIASHQQYIERDEAAETVQRNDRDFEREISPTEFQNYIERPEAAEKPDDFLNDERGAHISSFGTISENKDEREAFWLALEEAERKPSPAVFHLRPDLDAELYARVCRDPEVPLSFVKAIAMGEPSFVPEEKDAVTLFRIFHEAGFTPSAKHDPKKDWPLRIEMGRGGNVQTRVIIALPHEMSPEERLALARDFAKPYAERNIPFWAVIHAPEAHNDQRNFHLHMNIATRPAIRIPHPETGGMVWDFSITEEKKYANRTRRTLRPFMQKKLREMNHISWIPNERKRFSKLANQHLAKGGYEKRLDPRSHQAMDLQTARTYLTKNDYGRERRGEPTPAGQKLADQQWAELQEGLAHLAAARSRARALALVEHKAMLERIKGPKVRRRGQILGRMLIETMKERDTLQTERGGLEYIRDRIVSRARLKRPARRTPEEAFAMSAAREIHRDIQRLTKEISTFDDKQRKIENEIRTFRLHNDRPVIRAVVRNIKARLDLILADLDGRTVNQATILASAARVHLSRETPSQNAARETVETTSTERLDEAAGDFAPTGAAQAALDFAGETTEGIERKVRKVKALREETETEQSRDRLPPKSVIRARVIRRRVLSR